MPSPVRWLVAFAIVALLFPTGANAQPAGPQDLDFPGVPPASFGPSGVAVLQGPVIHAGSSPLATCYDAVGVVYGVPTLYVVDLYDGFTFLYDANDLSLLGSIFGPTGVSATTGLTTDGLQLYWVADDTLFTSAMDGSGIIAQGPIAFPGGGAVGGDVCYDALGRIWAVDIANDQISAHAAADGSHLGPLFAHPGGVDAFGNGIAFRSDCERLEIPYGVAADGQVTAIAVTTDTGMVLDSLPIGGLGVFVNGVEAAVPSPGFGGYSLFVVENATNALYEIAGIDPCPTPQPDCHESPGVGYRLRFEDFPLTTATSTPDAPISDTFPTTVSTISISGAAAPVLLLDCGLDISHTWIGDLDVTLTDVSAGVTVQLHDSAGVASDDILATFADDGRAYGPPFAAAERMQPSGGALSDPGPGAMEDFAGADADGQWRLSVTDNFPGEDGTLNQWSLGIRVPLPIPDGDPSGVTLLIDGDPSILDAVGDLDVELEIDHPAAEQLLIELESPDGTIVVLQQPGGPPQDGLNVRYDDPSGFNDGFGDSVPDGPGLLADMDGLPVAGGWQLRISDPSAGSTGVVRRAELLVCAADCLVPQGLSCTSDCESGLVSLSWTNPQLYSALEIQRDGVTIATLPATATTYDDARAAGSYEYAVVGQCTGAGAAATFCSVVHAPSVGERNLIFAGEAPNGAIDSVSALRVALEDAGEALLVTDTLDYPCLDELPADGVVWVCLGTYPANYVLSTAEGQALADLAASGRGVYIEGADTWGFDPPTPFEDYDGVENGTALDGDDSFVAMVGATYGSLDLAGITASYSQDHSAGSDYTDRLLPTGTTVGFPLDVPGAGAGTIWLDDGASYVTGVFYAPAGSSGRVISQSWEFGGFEGDTAALVTAYRSALFAGSEPSFQRGNVNGVDSTGLADGIALLNYLFVPLSPVPGCLDAADVNDDGNLALGDPVFLLNYLFVPGSPVPPAPGPGPACGPDPTPDPLGCETPTAGC